MTAPAAAPDTRRLLRPPLVVSFVLTATSVAAFLSGGADTRLVVVGIAAAALAVYATAVHPLSIFVAFAAVLGAAPYIHVPSTPAPLLLVLAVGIWVAWLFLPDASSHVGWTELSVVLLAALAVLSVVATGVSPRSLLEYVTWVAATAVVIPLRHLPTAARVTTIRTFVIGTGIGSLLGLLLEFNLLGPLSRLLMIAGYDPAKNVRLVYGSEGITARLNGTYLEPNVAGLVLAAGLLLAAAYFRGAARTGLLIVIGSGLLLTLSRAAIATVVVAAVLVVLRAPAHRMFVIVWGLAAGFLALAIPSVNERLLDSFGPSDRGSIDRVLSFRAFPDLMTGHWLWGLGWAREEFRDSTVSSTVNYVANGPLVTIYRGGAVLGLVAIVVLILLVGRSWAAARDSSDDAVVRCGVIAFVLVALQLDLPMVLAPPAVTTLSFLVAASLTHVPGPAGKSPHRRA
jgi:hypothetical protein